MVEQGKNVRLQDEFLSLSEVLMRQRPLPLAVTPVFKFGRGGNSPIEPTFMGLWQDGTGKRYSWEDLPREAVYAAVDYEPWGDKQ